MSTGVPAWLPLNSRGWPDSDRQFSEERTVVPARCPPGSWATQRCHRLSQPRSQLGEVGWADKSWLSTCRGDIIVQKSWNRCWRVDKNLLLICRDFRTGKARGGVKYLSSPHRDLAKSQTLLPLKSSVCQRFLQVLWQRRQQDVLSSRVTAAQYKQQLNGWTALYTGVVW